jgi:hypothetical protein
VVAVSAFMVWTFRICAALTVGLVLVSAFLLTRAFLGLAGKDAAIAGLIAMAAGMVTGGLAGFQYPTLRDRRSDADAGDVGGDSNSREAGGESRRSGSKTLIVGLVGVAGSGAASLYGLVAEGEVAIVVLLGLLASALNVGAAVWLRRAG